MNMLFMDRVENLMSKNRTFLCVGLDPDLQKIPAKYRQSAQPLLAFNKMVIDATKDLVCAYKPQIAYYAAHGAENELLETIHYIQKLGVPVILDSKRGDIGETAEMYAREAFERYAADAITVNPYMGTDTLQPYLKYKDKGVIVLCKTSNSGSGDLQDLKIDDKGQLLYEMIAEKAAKQWNENKNVLLVVGATHVEPLKKIRQLAPEITFLVPGVGAQGGDLKAVLREGLTSKKRGLIINSSRGIIYAGGAETDETSVRQAAEKVVQQMRDFL